MRVNVTASCDLLWTENSKLGGQNTLSRGYFQKEWKCKPNEQVRAGTHLPKERKRCTLKNGNFTVLSILLKSVVKRKKNAT